MHIQPIDSSSNGKEAQRERKQRANNEKYSRKILKNSKQLIRCRAGGAPLQLRLIVYCMLMLNVVFNVLYDTYDLRVCAR